MNIFGIKIFCGQIALRSEPIQLPLNSRRIICRLAEILISCKRNKYCHFGGEKQRLPF